MTLELWLLLGSGIIALAAGGAVLVASPGRLASVMAGGALAVLGLLQVGLARALFAFSWGGRNTWFELCMVLALAVSIVWVLLSASLSRTTDLSRLRGWRVYVLVQAGLCLLATVVATISPLVGETAAGTPPQGVPLHPAGRALLTLVLINVILVTANFESTYVTLPRRDRHRFGPALFGIVLCAAYYIYLLGFCLWHGHISLTDLGGSGIPVSILALLLAIAMTRGRIGEITLSDTRTPIHRSASLLLPALTFAAAIGVLQLTAITGWSLARTSWTLMTSALVVGLAAFLVSNRLQRRARSVLQPYLARPRLRRSDLWIRLQHRIHGAHSPDELHRIVPACVRDLAGLSPVTLFVHDPSGRAYVVVSSTLDPPPSERVRLDDPLSRELRRARRPLFLAGRSDDLEYIPIYVENGTQLRACRAEWAVPIEANDELLGFLLCGRPIDPDEPNLGRVPLLGFLALGVATRLEVLLLRAQVSRATHGRAPLDTPRSPS